MGKSGGIAVAALFAAGTFMLTGCVKPPPYGYAIGRVTQSPGCGVVQPNRPPCPDRPVEGKVLARAADGTIKNTVEIFNSYYLMFVEPGTYTLVVDAGGGTWPQCPETPVVLTLNTSKEVNILCGSGIR
jgi:hypothetical protein